MKEEPHKVKLNPDAVTTFVWYLDFMIMGKISLEKEFPEIATKLDELGYVEVCDHLGNLIYRLNQ